MLNKVLSGRFLLTVICGAVFGYAVVTKQLPPECTASIIVMVFTSYFNKRKEE